MVSEALRTAKTIICEEVQRYGVGVQRILLFGSRARGDARFDSDWDFLLIVDRPLERALQRRLATAIGVRLVRERMPADVLVLSASQFDQHKSDVGHIAYYVHKEGMPL